MSLNECVPAYISSLAAIRSHHLEYFIVPHSIPSGWRISCKCEEGPDGVAQAPGLCWTAAVEQLQSQ